MSDQEIEVGPRNPAEDMPADILSGRSDYPHIVGDDLERALADIGMHTDQKFMKVIDADDPGDNSKVPRLNF